MMALSPEQTNFLNSYIQKHTPDTTSASETVSLAPSTKLMPIWQSAKEKTDTGISALQNALRSHNHQALDRIADAGLNGITEGNQTAMMRALFEFDAAPDDTKQAVGQRVLEQAQTYSAFLEANAIITLAEENPFGVKVEIRKPLRSALAQIMRVAA